MFCIELKLRVLVCSGLHFVYYSASTASEINNRNYFDNHLLWENSNENICLDNDVDCDDVLNDFLQKRNFSEVWDRRKQACKTDRSLQRPWQHGTSGDT